jgi:hypothetical protein
MPVILNQRGINALKINLGIKLQMACSDGSAILRENTPIDTKRLWKSTRPMGIEITRNAIKSGIVAGGLSLKGINREQTLTKDVVYAIYVNNRTGYIENSIPEIVSAIKRRLSD